MGAKKRAEGAATILESESDSESEWESDLESNKDPGREEEFRGASGSSGAGKNSNPPRKTRGRKHIRGVRRSKKNLT